MVAVLIVTVVLLVMLISLKKQAADRPTSLSEAEIAVLEGMLERNKFEILEGTAQRISGIREEISKSTGDLRAEISKTNAELRAELGASNAELRTELGKRILEQSLQNEQKLDSIRTTMETRINSMQEDNSRQLDKMRETVDEKLQKTLNERISQSFKIVTDQLDAVSKGLGEMQALATGVGDLKKVLSNVKNRGILGEYQLGAILEEILSHEQYEENISTKKGSNDRVEFAIRLPGDDENHVYLPIDAKFPADAYARLVDAYEEGDASEIDAAGKALDTVMKLNAKSIHEKYVQPPETTDFAIMFLPFEGLYAEVVRRGMVEELQRLYKVNIAGPTTMAALLNSLQMGFKTLAIQKRSSEVWNVLSGIKNEFEKFEGVLTSAQKRINQANNELDTLIGTRTRAINRKLRNVSSLDDVGVTTSLSEPYDESNEDGDSLNDVFLLSEAEE
jgi:DNA recombination protein RmuC